MKGLGSLERILERTIEVVAGILLMFLMVLTCADVIGRYVFLAPVAGTHEITELGMGVLVFLTLPLVTSRGAHISITLIDRWIPRSAARPHYGAVQAFSIVVLIVLSWRILETAAYLGGFNETTTFLKIPKAPLAYFLGVMAGFSALLNTVVLVRALRRSAKPKPRLQ